MKANEFVKSFGWSSLEIAKTLPRFNRCKYVIFYADKIDFSNEFHAGRKSYMFEVIEVERLVESHEYIESYGGLIESKRTLEMRHSAINLDGWDKLKQAIADVESCMEGV